MTTMGRGNPPHYFNTMAEFTYPTKSIREGYGDIEFTRENILLLHSGKGVNGLHVGKVFPDGEIAALFGITTWEASCARKLSSYWDGKPAKSEIIEVEFTMPETQKPKKRKSKKSAE